MPADGLPWLERSALLTFEEIERVVRVFATMGVDELRLTGGEPLVRRDFPRLLSMLAPAPGLRDVSLTTHGLLLRRHADPRVEARLKPAHVSIDPLQRHPLFPI